jgi:hypothetical protein
MVLVIGFSLFAMDAMIIDLGFKPPFDFVPDSTSSDVAADSSATQTKISFLPPSPSASPAPITTYAVAAAKTSFSYPGTWGTVSLSNIEGYTARASISPKKDTVLAIKGSFDKNPDIEFYITRTGVLGEKQPTPEFYELQQVCDFSVGKKGFKTTKIKTTNPSASPSPGLSASPTPTATVLVDTPDGTECITALPGDALALSSSTYLLHDGAKIGGVLGDMYVINLKSPEYVALRFVDKKNAYTQELKTLSATVTSN